MIATLAAADGPLQMSLFDAQDLAEISHPDYPGERLIACRNPALAAERPQTRRAARRHRDRSGDHRRAGGGGRAQRGRPHRGNRGKIIGKYKVGKHFERRITDTSFTYERNHAAIAAEAALDGIYVLRTNVAATELDAAAVVTGYKNLAHIERDFRSIKTDDLDLRPIHHRLTERVKAHALICMLAAT